MEYNKRYLVSAEGREALLSQQINRVFNDIDNRISDLEFEASEVEKKPEISRAVKSALLHELGVMDYLLGLGISQKKIVEILSLVFNSSDSNIEKDLSTRHSNDANFKKEEAYKFVVDKFKELKLADKVNAAQATLTKIEESKGK